MKKLLFSIVVLLSFLASQGKKPGFVHRCAYFPAKGACDQMTKRFFYNITSGQCETFDFGGCLELSTANDFVTKGECEEECSLMPPISDFTKKDCLEIRCTSQPCSYGHKKDQYGCLTCACKLDPCEDKECNDGFVCQNITRGSSIQAYCRDKKMPETCTLPSDPGNGEKKEGKWHFYPITRRCMQFMYLGSGGNKNRFDSLSDCLNTCGDYVKPSYEICGLKKDEGRACENKVGLVGAYYFDNKDGKCKDFIYEGCSGNNNRFQSKESCEYECQGVFNDKCPEFECDENCKSYKRDEKGCRICACAGDSGGCDSFNCKEGLVCRLFHQSSSSTLSRYCVDPTITDVCQRPPDKGTCIGKYTKYYYDSTEKMCKPFIYSGCDGNSNNFDSEEICNYSCRREVVQPPVPVGSCPEIQCLTTCKYKTIYTSSGCPTCRCMEPPNCTLERQCDRRACPSGFEVDKNDCATCRCVKPGYDGERNIFPCPPLAPKENKSCDCPFGSDWRFGCSTCDCLPDPCSLRKKCPKGTRCAPLESKKYEGVYDTAECVPNNLSQRCTLPLLSGDGVYKQKKYGYDPVGKQCVEFTYTGINGNPNNFMTMDDCEVHCGKRRQVCRNDRVCALHCPYGRNTDDYGCEICSCRENPCNNHKCLKGFACELHIAKYNRPFPKCIDEISINTVELTLKYYHDEIANIKDMNIDHFKTQVLAKLRELIKVNFKIVNFIVYTPDVTSITIKIEIVKIPHSRLNLVQAVQAFREDIEEQVNVTIEADGRRFIPNYQDYGIVYKQEVHSTINHVVRHHSYSSSLFRGFIFVLVAMIFAIVIVVGVLLYKKYVQRRGFNYSSVGYKRATSDTSIIKT